MFFEIQLSWLDLEDFFSASYWDLVKRFCNVCLLSSQGFDEGECEFAGDLSVELPIGQGWYVSWLIISVLASTQGLQIKLVIL